MNSSITLNKDQIAEFCQRNHISRLSLFGSVLRSDFGPASDIDVLIEFDEDQHVGLFDMARMERELSEIVGRKVDLRTPEDLSRYFRQEVLETAVVQFAQAG